MKKIFLLGAFTLLSFTVFSCTSDDYQEIKKEANAIAPSYSSGPGDEPVVVQPPKKNQ
jgi:hypothetical protein